MMAKSDLLVDEELIIRDGGEIPEVAFHSSLFYLTEDQTGPNISLSAAEIDRLKMAVIFCYRRIILRDLLLEKRDKGVYRGLERCRLNWQRLVKFCSQEKLSFASEKELIGEALKQFMDQEVAEVKAGLRHSSINCSWENLQEFCEQLDLDYIEVLPDGWQAICCKH